MDMATQVDEERLEDDPFLEAFRRGRIAPDAFDHRAHVRAGAAALARLPFLDACIAMRDGLRLLAAAARRPDLYHETLTIAFMVLIADALDDDGEAGIAWDGVDGLIARHPALADRGSIPRRYDAATLQSKRARRRLCLPASAP
jgi:hypothetical protein